MAEQAAKRVRKRASHVTVVRVPEELARVRNDRPVVTIEALLLSVEAAAEAFNWSTQRMYDALKAGEIEYLVIGGRKFVPMVALKAYVRGLLLRRGNVELAEAV